MSTPVHRLVWAAGVTPSPPTELPLPPTLAHPRLMTGGLYRFRSLLFLYTEWLDAPGTPADLLPDLEPLLSPQAGPDGPLTWVPLVDVFHFNEPVDSDHWRRPSPPQQRLGRVAFLKPPWVASYIYYHYQLQEERAFGGGKYESIYLWGTLLFQYKELPSVLEAPVVPGKLATHGTPADWTQARMDRHFQPWPDGYLYFKDLECLTQS